MIYLQGTGGVVWPHNVEDKSQLPEYARHQLKTGELNIVAPPEGHTEEGMDRPSENASKAVWARYIRSFEGTELSATEVKEYSRADLIAWADDLERDEAKVS